MSLTPAGRIRFLVTGARGATFADVARSSGSFGSVENDSDAQVLNKFANYAIEKNPGFKGEDGAPGNSPATNLRDYGGNPDTDGTSNGLQNSQAFSDAISAQAKYIAIYSDTGEKTEWRFDSKIPASGLVSLDVDPNVTLSEPSDEILYDSAPRFIQPTHRFFRNYSTEYISRPDSNLPFDEKQIFIDRFDNDDIKWLAVDCNNSSVVKPLTVSWPGSDSWSGDTFSATSGKAFRTVGGADGNYHMGMHRMLPGRRIFARPALVNGTPMMVAIIRHTGGFAGVLCSSSNNSLSIIDKTNGLPGSSANVNSFINDTHESYYGKNSEWSISIENWQSGSIYFNGTIISRFKTSGYIFEAGFGIYGTASGDNVEWQDVVIANNICGGGELVSCAVFGDSRSAKRDGSWPAYARQALDLTNGIRCVKFDNYAVPGQGTPQQLALMQNTSLNYTDVHINIGTNDVQGGISVAEFLANISAMANLAINSGATPTFSIFDMWYSQDLSGGRGQPSLNYEKSAPYRSAIRRYCAENRIRLVDETILSGPIIRNYVNAATSPNYKGQGDPAVYDNIHPTSLLNRIKGHSIARLIATNHFAVGGVELGAQGLSPLNGWGATIEQPLLRITPGGTVVLEGVINDIGGANRADGTTICILPPHVRRRGGNLRFIPVNGIYQVCTLDLNVFTGEIKIYNAGSSPYFDISCIQFSLEE